jgi:mono/diheme cytochrome c family protein
VLQTWLVYSDPTGRSTPPLSVLAADGRQVWHRNNCQSCHQLYGFGGFLGPDLTNSIDDLSPARLDSILTVGSQQMPAFELDSGEREAVTQFLREMAATGVAQPRRGKSVPPSQLLRNFVARAIELDGPLATNIARGFAIAAEQGCISCHLPNPRSLHRAPDLTTMHTRVERDRLLTLLDEGIPGKAMPRMQLSAADGEAVSAFLAWMEERGDAIRMEFASIGSEGQIVLSAVPWFEY